jgi:hypothetical protein
MHVSSVTVPDGEIVETELPGVQRSPMPVADFAAFCSEEVAMLLGPIRVGDNAAG